MFLITGLSGNYKLVIAGLTVGSMMVWYLDEVLKR